MKYLGGLVLVVLLSGCTAMGGVVKDVAQDGSGKLTVTKCDLKVYLAFYALVSAEENCRQETK